MSDNLAALRNEIVVVLTGPRMAPPHPDDVRAFVAYADYLNARERAAGMADEILGLPLIRQVLEAL